MTFQNTHLAVKKALIFGLISISLTITHADSSLFSWSEVINIARTSNPTYLASKQSYQAQTLTTKAGWNRLFPSLALNSGYSESDTSREGTWDASARAQIELLNAQNIADLRSDQAAVRRSLADFRLVSADVRYELKKAFINLLVSQELVGVTERVKDIRFANAETVALKYESGRESKGNRMLVYAELLSAQAEVDRARRSLTLARRELNTLLGEKKFVVSIVTGTFDLAVLPEAPRQEFDVRSHPKIERLYAQVDVARASLAGARSTFWPSLSASYTRSATGDSYFPKDKHWGLSGSLSLPYFSQGPTFSYYSQKSAQHTVEQLVQQTIAGELQLQTDLETAWRNLADAVDRVRVRKEFLSAARQRNDESTVRYSMGYMSFDDWERAVADVVNYELSMIQSFQDALVAEADWNHVQAISLEDL